MSLRLLALALALSAPACKDKDGGAKGAGGGKAAAGGGDAEEKFAAWMLEEGKGLAATAAGLPAACEGGKSSMSPDADAITLASDWQVTAVTAVFEAHFDLNDGALITVSTWPGSKLWYESAQWMTSSTYDPDSPFSKRPLVEAVARRAIERLDKGCDVPVRSGSPAGVLAALFSEGSLARFDTICPVIAARDRKTDVHAASFPVTLRVWVNDAQGILRMVEGELTNFEQGCFVVRTTASWNAK